MVALAILALVLLEMVFHIGIKCQTYEFFGLYCPGCGGTRMAEAMLHLDFYQAFRYNPFLFVTVPIMVVIFIWQAYKYIMGGRTSAWLDKALITYSVLLVAFGVLRNVGVFKFLAPTEVMTHI